MMVYTVIWAFLCSQFIVINGGVNLNKILLVKNK
jgi:hypothetical protein